MDSGKILVISITGVVVLITILVLIYKAYSILTSKLGVENALILGPIDTSLYSVIPSAEMIKPRDGFNYTFFISMKVKNYYHNYGYWRHIFHVGTDIDSNDTLEYPYEGEGIDNWDSVIADIPNQNPGLWLHPTKNSLRLVITTEQHEVGNYPEHAHPETEFRASDTEELDTTKRVINTIDIPDVPMNNDINLGFVIFQNSVTVYLNGRLRNIFTIIGKPYENIGSMYIHKNKTYSGLINKLEIHPTVLSDKKILQKIK